MKFKHKVVLKMRQLLLSNAMVAIYSWLSVDDIDGFVEQVKSKRFDRALNGDLADEIRGRLKLILRGERTTPVFVPVIEEMGNMSFRKLPVDTADTTKPEVRIFTEADVQKSEGVLAIDVVTKQEN